ncbi:MAG: general secretion pathway protein GspK [Pedosphaera sp.]|nr:general secretion pathway protein GspK [Pedosphaera sp.]
MKVVSDKQNRKLGIALIIVMLVIVSLAALAGKFAASMKVETVLVRQADADRELEWLCRSGVDFARFLVGQQATVALEPYDSLNQRWAGGPGATNNPLQSFSLTNQLGNGTFTVRIVDWERYFNINSAADRKHPIGRQALESALTQMGVEDLDKRVIIDSIVDWRDADGDSSLNGAEMDYYANLPRPYLPKNGPIDDLSELLLIRGITSEMYWGTNAPSALAAAAGEEVKSFPVTLRDFFAPMSVGFININTASDKVLQLIPGIDAALATSIIRVRAGPDGVDGTGDDTPFRNVSELATIGFGRETIDRARRFLSVKSATFEVEVEAEIEGRKRRMRAVLNRASATDVKVLVTHRQ